MAFEDLGKKASDFAKENSAKINDALQSEQAEGISDKLLGGAADLANKITGGKHAAKIEDVRGNLDDKIGNE
jgi:phage terminase small subunit